MSQDAVGSFSLCQMSALEPPFLFVGKGIWKPSSGVLVTNRMLMLHVFDFSFSSTSLRRTAPRCVAIPPLLCTAFLSYPLVFFVPSSHSSRGSLQEENPMLQWLSDKEKTMQHGCHPKSPPLRRALDLGLMFIHSLPCILRSLPRTLWGSCSEPNALLSPHIHPFLSGYRTPNKQKANTIVWTYPWFCFTGFQWPLVNCGPKILLKFPQPWNSSLPDTQPWTSSWLGDPGSP